MTPVKASSFAHDPGRGTMDPGGLRQLIIHVESMDEIVSALAAPTPTATGSSWPGGLPGISGA